VKIEICGEYGRGINKSLIMVIQPFTVSADLLRKTELISSLEKPTEELSVCPECCKAWFFKVLDHGTSILKTSNVIKAVAAYNKI